MTIVYFDLETGGIKPENPDIQLAAIACDESGSVVGEFERKIVFSVDECDPKALELNSYDEAIWGSEAIRESLVVTQFGEFVKRFADIEMISKRTGRPYNVARLAGYNAATFDGPRIQSMFQRNNSFLPAHPQVMCVLNLALWVFHGRADRPKSMKLGDVCEFFGIPIQAHDALGDVKATAKLASVLRREVRLAA